MVCGCPPEEFIIEAPENYQESDIQQYLDDKLLPELPSNIKYSEQFFGKNNDNIYDFTNEEIKAAVDFCHLYQVKVYVTLNVLIKEGELPKALEFASYLIEIGVDGIIVQDLGLLGNIRKLSPDVSINASTQMTACDSSGVNLLESLGVNRVVLARELSKTEIENIREKTNIELEMFVHGAMCMSWSGQCLLSSFIGARRGNRGLCAQPCRLSYKLLKDNKAVTQMRPLLCMKDLCLAGEIGAVKEMVDSAKIEGRCRELSRHHCDRGGHHRSRILLRRTASGNQGCR